MEINPGTLGAQKREAAALSRDIRHRELQNFSIGSLGGADMSEADFAEFW